MTHIYARQGYNPKPVRIHLWESKDWSEPLKCRTCKLQYSNLRVSQTCPGQSESDLDRLNRKIDELRAEMHQLMLRPVTATSDQTKGH